jgi:hypothetical protein
MKRGRAKPRRAIPYAPRGDLELCEAGVVLPTVSKTKSLVCYRTGSPRIGAMALAVGECDIADPM